MNFSGRNRYRPTSNWRRSSSKPNLSFTTITEECIPREIQFPDDDEKRESAQRLKRLQRLRERRYRDVQSLTRSGLTNEYETRFAQDLEEFKSLRRQNHASGEDSLKIHSERKFSTLQNQGTYSLPRRFSSRKTFNSSSYNNDQGKDPVLSPTGSISSIATLDDRYMYSSRFENEENEYSWKPRRRTYSLSTSVNQDYDSLSYSHINEDGLEDNLFDDTTSECDFGYNSIYAHKRSFSTSITPRRHSGMMTPVIVSAEAAATAQRLDQIKERLHNLQKKRRERESFEHKSNYEENREDATDNEQSSTSVSNYKTSETKHRSYFPLDGKDSSKPLWSQRIDLLMSSEEDHNGNSQEQSINQENNSISKVDRSFDQESFYSLGACEDDSNSNSKLPFNINKSTEIQYDKTDCIDPQSTTTNLDNYNNNDFSFNHNKRLDFQNNQVSQNTTSQISKPIDQCKYTTHIKSHSKQKDFSQTEPYTIPSTSNEIHLDKEMHSYENLSRDELLMEIARLKLASLNKPTSNSESAVGSVSLESKSLVKLSPVDTVNINVTKLESTQDNDNSKTHSYNITRTDMVDSNIAEEKKPKNEEQLQTNNCFSDQHENFIQKNDKQKNEHLKSTTAESPSEETSENTIYQINEENKQQQQHLSMKNETLERNMNLDYKNLEVAQSKDANYKSSLLESCPSQTQNLSESSSLQNIYSDSLVGSHQKCLTKFDTHFDNSNNLTGTLSKETNSNEFISQNDAQSVYNQAPTAITVNKKIPTENNLTSSKDEIHLRKKLSIDVNLTSNNNNISKTKSPRKRNSITYSSEESEVEMPKLLASSPVFVPSQDTDYPSSTEGSEVQQMSETLTSRYLVPEQHLDVVTDIKGEDLKVFKTPIKNKTGDIFNGRDLSQTFDSINNSKYSYSKQSTIHLTKEDETSEGFISNMDSVMRETIPNRITTDPKDLERKPEIFQECSPKYRVMPHLPENDKTIISTSEASESLYTSSLSVKLPNSSLQVKVDNVDTEAKTEVKTPQKQIRKTLRGSATQVVKVDKNNSAMVYPNTTPDADTVDFDASSPKLQDISDVSIRLNDKTTESLNVAHQINSNNSISSFNVDSLPLKNIPSNSEIIKDHSSHLLIKDFSSVDLKDSNKLTSPTENYSSSSSKSNTATREFTNTVNQNENLRTTSSKNTQKETTTLDQNPSINVRKQIFGEKFNTYDSSYTKPYKSALKLVAPDSGTLLKTKFETEGQRIQSIPKGLETKDYEIKQFSDNANNFNRDSHIKNLPEHSFHSTDSQVHIPNRSEENEEKRLNQSNVQYATNVSHESSSTVQTKSNTDRENVDPHTSNSINLPHNGFTPDNQPPLDYSQNNTSNDIKYLQESELPTICLNETKKKILHQEVPIYNNNKENTELIMIPPSSESMQPLSSDIQKLENSMQAFLLPQNKDYNETKTSNHAETANIDNNELSLKTNEQSTIEATTPTYGKGNTFPRKKAKHFKNLDSPSHPEKDITSTEDIQQLKKTPSQKKWKSVEILGKGNRKKPDVPPKSSTTGLVKSTSMKFLSKFQSKSKRQKSREELFHDDYKGKSTDLPHSTLKKGQSEYSVLNPEPSDQQNQTLGSGPAQRTRPFKTLPHKKKENCENAPAEWYKPSREISPLVSPFNTTLPKQDEELFTEDKQSLNHWDPSTLFMDLYNIQLVPDDTQDLSQNFIEMEGVMEKLPMNKKKSTLLKTWKRRYFIAKNGWLIYYDNHGDQHPSDEILLMGGTITMMNNLVIGIDDNRGHYLMVRCPSAKEYDQWLTALQSQTVDNIKANYIQPLLDAPKCIQKNILIIEMGSMSLRAGILKENPTLPQIFFPNVVAVNYSEKKHFVGFEAYKPCNRLDSKLIHLFGLSDKIDKFKIEYEILPSIFTAIFQDLKVNPKDYQVMMVLPLPVCDKDKGSIMEILMNRFNVKGVCMVTQAITALYSYNTKSGVMVDIGERMEVIPIYDGFAIETGQSVQTYGAGKVRQSLRLGLAKHNFPMYSPIEQIIIRYVMEQTCYVSKHYAEEIHKYIEHPEKFLSSLYLNKYDVPKDSHSTISHDVSRFAAPEGFFNTDLWGMDYPTVQALVLKAINACPLDSRRYICRSIYLSGGVTMIPGFSVRLEKEVQKLVNPSLVVQVHSSPQRYHAAYIGACILSALPEFEDHCISVEEWKKEGTKAFRKWIY
ncbi:uncharacterized protein LOC115213538 isoform X2 [Argonauta hians]